VLIPDAGSAGELARDPTRCQVCGSRVVADSSGACSKNSRHRSFGVDVAPVARAARCLATAFSGARVTENARREVARLAS
jgi:hypothetical protein